MIVDASAVLAILLDEPDAKLFANAIIAADNARIAAPGWLEVAMRVESIHADNDAAYQEVNDRFMSFTANNVLRIEPFSGEHAFVARSAFRKFGKGRHPAGLNFGDCIAYATAKLAGAPLLFKGNDFIYTDIEPALKY
jgi:ribonuclease VapC